MNVSEDVLDNELCGSINLFLLLIVISTSHRFYWFETSVVLQNSVLPIKDMTSYFPLSFYCVGEHSEPPPYNATLCFRERSGALLLRRRSVSVSQSVEKRGCRCCRAQGGPWSSLFSLPSTQARTIHEDMYFAVRRKEKSTGRTDWAMKWYRDLWTTCTTIAIMIDGLATP